MDRISVVGFGKIGQSIVARMLQAGLPVTAIDINPALADAFAAGTFATDEPGVQEILRDNFAQRQLLVTTDFAQIRSTAAVVVAIPLLVDTDKKIVERPFLDCFAQIAPHLSDGCLVSGETSVPVGYSRRKILPILQQAQKRHGKDFYLIHSPERIKSGTMLRQLVTNPKVIGGIDQEATKKGMEVYAHFLDPKLLVAVASIETAEMIKLAGMAYRDVNIALANELAMYCQQTGIDITEVIRHANTDGEAFLLNPGIGVGGHCTPVYPYFLIDNFAQMGMEFRLARHSREINDGMAAFAVEMAGDVPGKKALICGLGFRADVKEDIFSTAYLLRHELQQRGYRVLLHDPLFSSDEIKAKGFEPAEDIYAAGCKIVYMLAPHRQYHTIDWARLRTGGCRKFVDGRNFFDGRKIVAAGLEYMGIGKQG